MPLDAVSGKVRTLVVIWFTPEFDLEAYVNRVSDRKEARHLLRTSFAEGNKTIERLLHARYSGGRVVAILFQGDKLLSEKPEGSGIIGTYISPKAPDPDITLVFPNLMPDYYPKPLPVKSSVN